MKLTMLGTGRAIVTRCYNTCFVLEHDGHRLLVDGGGGNTLLKRLKQAGLSMADIGDIFVTHKHMDHLLGIVWVLRIVTQSVRAGRMDGSVRIYSHKEVIELLELFAQRLLKPSETALIGRNLHFITVTDGMTLPLLGRPVTFFDIHSTKDTQFGFSMAYKPGARFVCLGDEPCHSSSEHIVRGCDWLTHEAFCLAKDADFYKPYEKHHSTARDACALAARLGVKNLILYHTEDDNLATRRHDYTAEGRTVYNGNIFVPDDLDVIDID